MDKLHPDFRTRITAAGNSSVQARAATNKVSDKYLPAPYRTSTVANNLFTRTVSFVILSPARTGNPHQPPPFKTVLMVSTVSTAAAA